MESPPPLPTNPDLSPEKSASGVSRESNKESIPQVEPEKIFGQEVVSRDDIKAMSREVSNLLVDKDNPDSLFEAARQLAHLKRAKIGITDPKKLEAVSGVLKGNLEDMRKKPVLDHARYLGYLKYIGVLDKVDDQDRSRLFSATVDEDQPSARQTAQFAMWNKYLGVSSKVLNYDQEVLQRDVTNNLAKENTGAYLLMAQARLKYLEVPLLLSEEQNQQLHKKTNRIVNQASAEKQWGIFARLLATLNYVDGPQNISSIEKDKIVQELSHEKNNAKGKWEVFTQFLADSATLSRYEKQRTKKPAPVKTVEPEPIFFFDDPPEVTPEEVASANEIPRAFSQGEAQPTAPEVTEEKSKQEVPKPDPWEPMEPGVLDPKKKPAPKESVVLDVDYTIDNDPNIASSDAVLAKPLSSGSTETIVGKGGKTVKMIAHQPTNARENRTPDDNPDATDADLTGLIKEAEEDVSLREKFSAQDLIKIAGETRIHDTTLQGYMMDCRSRGIDTFERMYDGFFNDVAMAEYEVHRKHPGVELRDIWEAVISKGEYEPQISYKGERIPLSETERNELLQIARTQKLNTQWKNELSIFDSMTATLNRQKGATYGNWLNRVSVTINRPTQRGIPVAKIWQAMIEQQAASKK